MFFKERAAASKKILRKNVRLLLKENVELLLRIMSTLRSVLKWKQIKIKMMKTYSAPRKPVTFVYFWLNYCDENHHIEWIPVAVKDIDHLFNLASEIIKADNLHLFLVSDGTRIDDNEHLESLENGTELIVCTMEQIQHLSSVKHWLFYITLAWTLMFIEAVLSGTSLVQQGRRHNFQSEGA